MSHRVCLVILGCLALCVPVVRGETKKWNIIAVVTDDQARWAVGVHGNKEVRTPHMDSLAKRGATFLNAFVTTPVCSPSRAGYLTGRFGTEVGITDWISPAEGAGGVGLATRFITWPRLLQKNGWTTGLIGKWHLGLKAEFHPGKHGLDLFTGGLSGGFAPLNPTWEVGGKDVQLKGYSADLVGDEAVRFITQNRARPFALLVHFREPHTPYTPMRDLDTAPFKDLDPTIPKWPGLDQKQVKLWTRQYYSCVHAVDRNLGRILGKLDDLKLSERTIVLFTSDHGYNIGHHGIHTKGNGYWIAGGQRGPKRPNMFDTSLRIPLLIRWPGVVKPGTKIDEMVTNLDTLPSVAGMLGVELPKDAKHHGKDFSPLLRGKKVAWRDTIFGQYDLHNGGLAYMRMIRTAKWKLVRHHRCDMLDELYNLEADPNENRNLYRNPKMMKTRNELQGRLTAWMKSIDDPLLRDVMKAEPRTK